jgi:hypothetical protein
LAADGYPDLRLLSRWNGGCGSHLLEALQY